MLLLLGQAEGLKLQQELVNLEQEIIFKQKEIEELNFRRKHLLSKLREWESFVNPKIEVKRITSSRKGIEDYYRATAWVWINDKKDRVVSYIGLCKNFSGDETSEEILNLAKEKIQETISKRYQIISPDK